MQKMLIIEDDPAIQKALQTSFEEEHFEISIASDGLQGFELALKKTADIILLDLMLPGKNGKEICQNIRSAGITIPILILTSKHDEMDKVLLLELGADDYVTKPPGLKELHARVKALLRRSSVPVSEKDSYSFGNLYLNFKKQEATRDNQPLQLSSKEFEILKLLIQNESEVISRDKLLDEVWGYDVYPTTRTVDNYILNLRKKLEEDPANPKHIITMPKAGYKFIANPE